MKIFSVLLLAIIVNSKVIAAQSQSDHLFVINDKTYGWEKFISYCRYRDICLSDLDRKSLNKITRDFAVTMIKHEKAISQGLDTAASIRHKKEKIYQLHLDSVRNYNAITEYEIREAYNRLILQRDISHIQITQGFPFPADSLKPYHRIMEIYDRLEKGEDFKELAYRLSDNSLTASDSGRIGSVTFGTLNYPMELNAFQTGIGNYSRPFSSWSGYQIMKVHSENPSPGFMDIAHIAMALAPGNNEENRKTIALMDSLRKLIIEGRQFEQLALAYSEDRSTAANGGFIGSISPGFRIREITDAAFSLEYDGQISPVVVTRNSVHIIKRIKLNPLPEYGEVRDSIRKVLAANEARSSFRKQAYFNRIKSRSGFVANPQNVSDYLMLGRICLQRGRWISPPDSLLDVVLFTIGYRHHTYQDLSRIMETGTYPYRITNYRPLIWKHYLEYEESILEDYLGKNFEKVFPEIASEIRWGQINILTDSLTIREVLQNLNYTEKELNRIYRKNKKRYIHPNYPGKILSFDSAFPQVLSDYQQKAVHNWERDLLRSNKVKIDRKTLRQLIRGRRG